MAKRKPKIKMPISERAKQFAPFSPLNGLEEALAEKERHPYAKRTLSDDAIAEINSILETLDKGETVTVLFYDHKIQTYAQITGQLGAIDAFCQSISVGSRKMQFDDIYEISVDG